MKLAAAAAWELQLVRRICLAGVGPRRLRRSPLRVVPRKGWGGWGGAWARRGLAAEARSRHEVRRGWFEARRVVDGAGEARFAGVGCPSAARMSERAVARRPLGRRSQGGLMRRRCWRVRRGWRKWRAWRALCGGWKRLSEPKDTLGRANLRMMATEPWKRFGIVRARASAALRSPLFLHNFRGVSGERLPEDMKAWPALGPGGLQHAWLLKGRPTNGSSTPNPSHAAAAARPNAPAAPHTRA